MKLGARQQETLTALAAEGGTTVCSGKHATLTSLARKGLVRRERGTTVVPRPRFVGSWKRGNIRRRILPYRGYRWSLTREGLALAATLQADR